MLCFALYSAGHAMQAAYKPLLEPLGLTYPQYLALAALWAKDGQTVGQIGTTLLLDSNTLTPLLKRLEQGGWITRQRDTGDERQVRITLTHAGRALQLEAAKVPLCFLDQTGLTVDHAAALRDALTTLRDRLRPR
jgi:DNA-binding MarR family transcriptional regulator